MTIDEKYRGFLIGQKEIEAYARRSWELILVWIRVRKFPAKKIDGVWESHTDLIDQWRLDQLRDEPGSEYGAETCQ